MRLPDLAVRQVTMDRMPSSRHWKRIMDAEPINIRGRLWKVVGLKASDTVGHILIQEVIPYRQWTA